jgi:hypothetical protein
MSHYQYKSRTESILRASLNNNPLRSFDESRDSLFNSVNDEGIVYLIPTLKAAILDQSRSNNGVC